MSSTADVFTILFLYVLEHEWMVAELSQLNDRVHQSLSSTLSLFALFRAISEQNTLTLHVPRIKLNLAKITDQKCPNYL